MRDDSAARPTRVKVCTRARAIQGQIQGQCCLLLELFGFGGRGGEGEYANGTTITPGVSLSRPGAALRGRSALERDLDLETAAANLVCLALHVRINDVTICLYC